MLVPFQGSRIHGHGLFTSKNLDSTYYAGMPVEGSFHVYNSTDQLFGAVKSDGVLRYAIGDTDTLLRKLCAPHEAVREGAVLYLRPDPSNFWFYANFSANTDVEANILPDVPFRKVKVKTPKDALELLSKANNVAGFKVASQVVKGTEVVFDYPVFENDASADDQDDDDMSDA